jgi:hypothetical protein
VLPNSFISAVLAIRLVAAMRSKIHGLVALCRIDELVKPINIRLTSGVLDEVDLVQVASLVHQILVEVAV